MKLKPLDYKKRQRRVSLSRAISNARNKPYHPYVKSRLQAGGEPLIPPKEIGIYTPKLHFELTSFLRTLRKYCTARKHVHIDFSTTTKVTSTGMLLMLAEIDRIYRAVSHRCLITCEYPSDEIVEKVFQQIGLFQILKKPCRLEVTENDTSVFHWKYATGVSVNPADADTMLKGVKDQLPKGYLRIVTGVEEAMDNAVHHAYIRPRGDRLTGISGADERRWWVFAEVLDGWLHVNFCDLGVGIPVTLPAKWKEQVKDIVSLTSLSDAKRDVRMIRRSLTLGRTRTEQPHRGKGLKNIMKAAQELGGRLQVYSNMAVVGVDFKSSTPIYIQAAFKRSILGTVIQWSVPITETQDLENEHD